jgi:CheY-like chemotaxis protein
VHIAEALRVEQARYIHRTIPLVVVGALLTAALVGAVFHAVVPLAHLYVWLGASALLALLRLATWSRYRGRHFDITTSRSWLRHARVAALASGVLWGLGSLFLFPPGELLYQFTFLFTVVMMSVAAMFSYAPHYGVFLCFVVPSLFPAIAGIAATGGPKQIGFAVGVSMVSVVVLFCVRAYNRMFAESVRLRFENLDYVAQLAAQKAAAESANVARSRWLAAASHDLRQPIHALSLYLSSLRQLELSRQALALLDKMRRCVQSADEMFRAMLDMSRLEASTPRTRLHPARDLAGTIVVVVDDEELILDATQALLEQWHCTVIAATSGSAALRQLAASARAPDVLICDYRLRNDETGIGVVEAVRHEFNADIPALLLTGETDPEQLRKISASGLAALHKPLREEELNDAIFTLRAPPSAAPA